MVGHLIGNRVKHLCSINIYMYYICICMSIHIYVLQIFSKFCLTKYSHSCELICSLSLNDRMQILNSLGCSFKLFYVLQFAIILCWYSEGKKLQLCNSTTHNLIRECLLNSFLRWITMVQAICLFSTLNCSEKYSFWVCLHLLDSYSYVIVKMMLKMLHSESVRKWIADTKKHSLYYYPLGQHYLKCCNAVLWYEAGNVCKYWRYVYHVLAQL